MSEEIGCYQGNSIKSLGENPVGKEVKERAT
jgi:hypothetical protein